jgi:hypothetical protein
MPLCPVRNIRLDIAVNALITAFPVPIPPFTASFGTGALSGKWGGKNEKTNWGQSKIKHCANINGATPKNFTSRCGELGSE